MNIAVALSVRPSVCRPLTISCHHDNSRTDEYFAFKFYRVMLWVKRKIAIEFQQFSLKTYNLTTDFIHLFLCPTLSYFGGILRSDFEESYYPTESLNIGCVVVHATTANLQIFGWVTGPLEIVNTIYMRI